MLKSTYKSQSLSSNKRQPNGSSRQFLKVKNIFTGIVQGKAQVKDIQQKNQYNTYKFQMPSQFVNDVTIGGSVAINGACLTVVKQENEFLYFDVIQETLRRTNLGQLSTGLDVNFERAARIGSEVGGHYVSGHISCIGTINNIDNIADSFRMTIEIPHQWSKYVQEKGFIAIDGVSLTLGETQNSTFNLYLIPETLGVTNLGKKKLGDRVNIEFDSQTVAVVDTVERYMEQYLKDKNLVKQ